VPHTYDGRRRAFVKRVGSRAHRQCVLLGEPEAAAAVVVVVVLGDLIRMVGRASAATCCCCWWWDLVMGFEVVRVR
jgi:hypothetical protein